VSRSQRKVVPRHLETTTSLVYRVKGEVLASHGDAVMDDSKEAASS